MKNDQSTKDSQFFAQQIIDLFKTPKDMLGEVTDAMHWVELVNEEYKMQHSTIFYRVILLEFVQNWYDAMPIDKLEKRLKYVIDTFDGFEITQQLRVTLKGYVLWLENDITNASLMEKDFRIFTLLRILKAMDESIQGIAEAA